MGKEGEGCSVKTDLDWLWQYQNILWVLFYIKWLSILEHTKQWSEVKPWSQDWLIAAGVYPGFCSMKRLEVFLLPLDGMLVHRRSLPRNLSGFPNNLPVPIFLYTWVERCTVRVKCLAQEHITMSPARARTRTARSELSALTMRPPRLHTK